MKEMTLYLFLPIHYFFKAAGTTLVTTQGVIMILNSRTFIILKVPPLSLHLIPSLFLPAHHFSLINYLAPLMMDWEEISGDSYLI
jgi:hypothetical protein